MNKVFITGNLTHDPEERMTASGMAIVTFSVAHNKRKKNPQTGEYEEIPYYFDCTMFGNRATFVASKISKGSKVAIDGELRYSQWEKDGQKRSKVDIVVDDVEFMSKAQERKSEPEYVEATYYDENIPF